MDTKSVDTLYVRQILDPACFLINISMVFSLSLLHIDKVHVIVDTNSIQYCCSLELRYSYGTVFCGYGYHVANHYQKVNKLVIREQMLVILTYNFK